MRAVLLSLFLLAISITCFSASAQAAQETNFLITVKARDAKFIGTAAGGARVTIRNRNTGEIIADGVTYGDTGDTAVLMAENRERGAKLVTPGSAKFQFSLEFWEPLPVTITATAPLGQQQSIVSVSEDMILLPGKDYTQGNGIMLEVPGFSVDVVNPLPNSKFPHKADIPVTVEANIMKLCGCKIEEGTPWAPERYEVETHIYKDGMYVSSFEMPYAGEPGVYAQNVNIPLAGNYRIMVTAFDPVTKESGMDSTSVILETTQENADE